MSVETGLVQWVRERAAGNLMASVARHIDGRLLSKALLRCPPPQGAIEWIKD